LIYWILHQQDRNERKTPAITLLQVNTNLTISAELTKTILFDEISFKKTAQTTACILIKVAQKNAIRNSKKIPQRNEKTAQLCGKTAQLAILKGSSFSTVNCSLHRQYRITVM